MTTDNFTLRNGGGCPVANGTSIDIKHKNGIISYGVIVDNSYRESNYYYVLKLNGDIIGWRLAEQPNQENEPVGYYKKDALYAADKFKEVCQVRYSGQYLDYVPVFIIPPDSAAIIAKLQADNAELLAALILSNKLKLNNE